MIFVAWALSAAAAPAAAPTSLQAQFEQASAALVGEKWEDALAGFKAIEALPGISNRTRGVVTLREATALRHLGRDEEARDLFRRGLAMVPANDPALTDDRIDALLAVGGLERGSYDYAAARADFQQALAFSTDDPTRMRVLLALASVTMFDDAKTALAYTDQLMKIATATKVSADVDATIHDMRGKVLLNMGNYSAALADLEIALKDLGGLTTRTHLDDVMVRSDLALAALKADKMDKAREYLGMTGEGRLPDGPFAAPADTNIPACGGDFQPDDVAVVEFGIGDDGKVTFANPVYASRPGPMATDFARAVSNWQWQESSVKTIPLFYRAVTRIELRCSNAVGRPGEVALLAPRYEKWLADNDLKMPSDSEKRDAAQLRAAIEADKNGRPIDRVPLLVALAYVPTLDIKDSKDLLDQAILLAEQSKAPTPASVYLRVLRLGQEVRVWRVGVGTYRAGLRALLARPDVQADAQSAGVVRLLIAAPALGSTPNDAGPLLQQIVDDKRLEQHDPLRVGALVRLSAIQKQRGDIDAARASYLQTGLSAQQCSLVDAQPSIRRVGVGSSDYPMDAYSWGIGGWTQIEFDVMPDGRTANRRAVMSYPPFTFGEPTVKAMAATRYTQTYRPDGATGCSGAAQRFRYIAPTH